jgi:P-type conjugative transfer ATPase TrbB
MMRLSRGRQNAFVSVEVLMGVTVPNKAFPTMVQPAVALDQSHENAADRLGEMLARYLGPSVLPAFVDEDVTEVYLNPQDGSVRVDTRSHGKVDTGTTLAAHRVEMLLNAVAASVGATLTADMPRLEAELPTPIFHGSRLQGFLPPVSSGPAFNIRKPPTIVYSLDDYVKANILTQEQRIVLHEGVVAHRNVLVVGGTNSGKTTLANALVKEITTRFPQERLVVLEDTVELQCAARDHLALRTGRHVALAELVKSALRTSPNRIIVGEVRGSEALDLLDVWATGHPGGVATVHASSAEGALLRLDRLAQRANVPSQAPLIAEAIHLIVVIEGGNAGRRVSDLVRVKGLDPTGRYILDRLTPAGDWQCLAS